MNGLVPSFPAVDDKRVGGGDDQVIGQPRHLCAFHRNFAVIRSLDHRGRNRIPSPVAGDDAQLKIHRPQDTGKALFFSAQILTRWTENPLKQKIILPEICHLASLIGRRQLHHTAQIGRPMPVYHATGQQTTQRISDKMNFSMVVLIECNHLFINVLNQRFQRNTSRWIIYIQYRETIGFKEFRQRTHGTVGTGDAVQNHDIIFIWSGIGQPATLIVLF